MYYCYDHSDSLYKFELNGHFFQSTLAVYYLTSYMELALSIGLYTVKYSV